MEICCTRQSWRNSCGTSEGIPEKVLLDIPGRFAEEFLEKILGTNDGIPEQFFEELLEQLPINSWRYS